MKKTLIFGVLLAIAAPVLAASSSDLQILRDARDEYYKNQKVSRVVEVQTDITPAKVVVEEVEIEEIENPTKAQTALEKLENTAAIANDKVDFYKRVVRSVAREEKEISDFNIVLGKDQSAKRRAAEKAKKKK